MDYAVKVEDRRISKTLQNSLAYYYADGNRHDREAEARKYATEALNEGGPSEIAALDTKGFVLICFGKTSSEVMEGVRLCHEAQTKGAPFEFYAKHVKKAESRLEELSTTAVAGDPQGGALGPPRRSEPDGSSEKTPRLQSHCLPLGQRIWDAQENWHATNC